MPPDPQPPAADTTGQPSWIAPVTPVIPDHELIRRIGGGSYGDVWLARNAVGTWRAVKAVFRDRFLDSRPFEREFNGIQKFEPLSRTNEAFVDVLQIGRNDAEGYFYYVMELADDAGERQKAEGRMTNEDSPRGDKTSSSFDLLPSYVPKTLAKVLLQRGRLPIAECLELGLTLNLGLAHLHKAGLIHRDIKPSNIIFVGGIPKLADIGLVIEMAEARSFVGTEGFIPPEGPNSPQADLYSLGKVLYEAGMGKDRKDFPEPFTHLAEAPDATQILEFNAVLLKACAASREDRYRSAEEMNADLALLQSGGSVRRQRKLTSQLRFVQRAGALVTALAGVIALGWWWQAKQTSEVRELADSNRLIADERIALAAEKGALAEENRERLVRLSVANGVRLLDNNDPTGALLWFAQALPLVTNRPAEEEIHRIRINAVMSSVPRLLQVVAHEQGVAVLTGAFSPDGRMVATGSADGELRVWEAETAQLLYPPLRFDFPLRHVQFSPDSHRLIVQSSRESAHSYSWFPAERSGFAAVLEAATGRVLYPPVTNGLKTVLAPDTRFLAVEKAGFAVTVIETIEGRVVSELIGHTDTILAMAFNPGGSLLVTGSRDGTARVWRIPSGQSEGSPLEHGQPVFRAVFHPNEELLATASGALTGPSEPCRIQVWDFKGGLAGTPSRELSGVAWALFYDPAEGRRLFVGEDSTVQVLDAASLAPVLPALEMDSAARHWTFNPNASAVVVGSDDSKARIWELEGGGRILPTFRHGGWVECAQVSPDGTRLLTTSDDGTAKLWSLEVKAESARLELPVNHPHAPAEQHECLGRVSKLLAVHLETGSVALVDSDSVALVRLVTPRVAGERLCTVAESPDGRCLALVEHHEAEPTESAVPHTVNLWHYDENGGLDQNARLPHLNAFLGIAFRENGSEVLTVDATTIRIWRVSDGMLIRSHTPPTHFSPVRADILQEPFTRDGRRILLERGDTFSEWTLQLFDLTSSELVGQAVNIARFAAMPNRMRLSPDGTRVAMVGSDQMGTIIHLETGDLAAPQFKHGGTLFDLDWSQDGTRLITTGLANDVKLWGAATGELLHAPMALPTSAPARSARWSADGRFIVGRNDDKVARVWDASTAEPVTPNLRHQGHVHWACVSPENRLITASGPNLLRAWDLKPTSLLADAITDYAKFVSGRQLNASGAMLPIPALELAELGRSLRARHPELFSSRPARD